MAVEPVGNPDLECPCVLHHVPLLMTVETHHVLPLSWGGADTKLNRVRVCPSAHYGTHSLLNEYVRARGTPAFDVLARYNRFAQELAGQAWNERKAGAPTPYWLPSHAPIHEGEHDGMARVRSFMGWAD